MAIPIINTVTPNNGSSGGNELVKIAGSGFSVICLFYSTQSLPK